MVHKLKSRCRRNVGIVAALIGLAYCGNTQAQTIEKTPPKDVREHRGLVILRISDDLLDRLLATDIDTNTPVDRCVLGTRAVGLTSTKGHADVDPKPDPDDAAFRVIVTGSSNSRTVGRNGPAVIRSHTSTKWQVEKVVRFDKGKFIAEPGVVSASRTQMTPLGVGASLPGLRGMLVRSIARRRVQESRAAAERISDNHTRGRVLSEVDEAINSQIATLNSEIASRPLLEYLLPVLDTGAVDTYTSQNCIHLVFLGVGSVTAVVCPLDRLEPRESELWIHSSLLGVPTVALPGPSAATLKWLGDQLSHLGLPPLPVSEADFPGLDALQTLGIEVIDGWLVLRSPPVLTDDDSVAPELANERPAARP